MRASCDRRNRCRAGAPPANCNIRQATRLPYNGRAFLPNAVRSNGVWHRHPTEMLGRVSTEMSANHPFNGQDARATASSYARTGTEAVRSSLPQLTHAPFTPRKIAFQTQ